MIKLLEELVKWTKVANIPYVKDLLLETLSKPEQKVAYQVSDGKNSRDVARIANVSSFTIIKWWEKWEKVGIAEAIPVSGGTRAIRSFSLYDFGIEIPEIVEADTKDKKTEDA